MPLEYGITGRRHWAAPRAPRERAWAGQPSQGATPVMENPPNRAITREVTQAPNWNQAAADASGDPAAAFSPFAGPESPRERIQGQMMLEGSRQRSIERNEKEAREAVRTHNQEISQAKEAENQAKKAEDNWHFFANAVATTYGKPDSTGKNLVLPENVKQAMFAMHQDALKDPDSALKNLTGHIQGIQETANQWHAHKAYYIKDKEQALGRKLTPEEVVAVDKLGETDPQRASSIIGALQSRGAKPFQPEHQGETRGLGVWTPWDKKAPVQQQPPALGQAPQQAEGRQNLPPGQVWADQVGTPGQPYAPIALPGTDPRAPALYGSDIPGRGLTQPDLVPTVPGEDSKDYVRRALPRNDQLSPEEARVRYNRAVEEGIGPTEGGFRGAAKWMAQNYPGVREALDPNSTIRRGARWVGNKVAEAYSSAPVAPQQMESPQVSPWLAGVTPGLAKQSAQTMGVTDEAGNVLHGPGGRPVQVGQPAGVKQENPAWLQPQNVAGAAPEDVNNLRGAGGRPLAPAPQRPWYAGG